MQLLALQIDGSNLHKWVKQKILKSPPCLQFTVQKKHVNHLPGKQVAIEIPSTLPLKAATVASQKWYFPLVFQVDSPCFVFFFSFGGIHQVELLHSSNAKGGVWGVPRSSAHLYQNPNPQRVKTTWPKAVTDHAPSANWPGTSNFCRFGFLFFGKWGSSPGN